MIDPIDLTKKILEQLLSMNQRMENLEQRS